MKKTLGLWAVMLASTLSLPAQAAHELNGYRSEFFPLKRIELKHRGDAGQSVMVAPSHWTQGLTSRDNIWIGDPNGDYTVQSFAHIEPLAGTVRETMEKVMKDVVVHAGNRSDVVGLNAKVEDDAVVVTFESEDPAAAPGMRLRNLFIMREVSEGVAVFGYHVVVRNALWRSPQTADIVQLFRAQLLRARLDPEPDIRDALPPPDPNWKLAFRELKTIEPYGFIRMRVPRRWQAHRDPTVLMYFVPNEETGTMHIGYEVMPNTEEAARRLGVEGKRTVKTMDRRFTDQGVKLHNRYWLVFDRTPDQFVLITVALTLDEDQNKDPEYQELVKILDQEIRRMRISVVPASSSDPQRAREGTGQSGRK